MEVEGDAHVGDEVSTSIDDVAGGDIREWHCVGRLDKDTSGLLLLTNDGGLVHAATNPAAAGHHNHHDENDNGGGGDGDDIAKKTIKKTYVAKCMGVLSSEQIQRLREGVELSGGLGTSNPAEVEMVEDDGRNCQLRITIGEGKNRQIRRMLHAVGSGVMTLQRVRFGGLRLDTTSECGSWRVLDAEEVERSLGYAVRELPGRRGATIRNAKRGASGGATGRRGRGSGRDEVTRGRDNKIAGTTQSRGTRRARRRGDVVGRRQPKSV